MRCTCASAVPATAGLLVGADGDADRGGVGVALDRGAVVVPPVGLGAAPDAVAVGWSDEAGGSAPGSGRVMAATSTSAATATTPMATLRRNGMTRRVVGIVPARGAVGGASAARVWSAVYVVHALPSQ
jgi:hypothetical protein